MQITEVRELSDSELEKELTEQERALMNLRFRKATMQLTNTNELGNTRKTIARIKTVIRERAITASMASESPESLAQGE
ncbi:MAG: 50S ribosomal protein L29 [SAR202 cluster bacterium]|jgi:large subunit ribosomal protein L29|nr:MAG: 50S ribosomal protein L29 [SAR202 cluster bacterium]MBF06701.1 50S ribosomal protein L29 [Chloroflexota bacterium]MCH2530214.1 50S ribosomal protein L29 [Dehalococcoidia bacterium]MQF63769.1 50S ribosomal protein L29 [SAR202 cluster bacterium AD-802-L14_MRT_200m]KAA1300220.1 MAG: 50S ribosomal protein L29 [SAR202 cluster bacterium]|tara:strand:- start:3860 stop:4096 length:237 start_codon:yes stop_codon:yes gene_type:complete